MILNLGGIFKWKAYGRGTQFHSFILDPFYAYRLRSDKKLVFSDNEVIDSISMTESTKSFCRQTSCFGTKRDALK